MKIFTDRLPAFPKTPHLPYKPNVDASDIIAEDVCLNEGLICVEEKIDGASVGICLDDEGNPLVRNRDHILKKGYVKKDTTAKKQFRPLWNYYYDNRRAFQSILAEGPFAIYGEWMWVQHGIHYTSLPDWFIPYDIYNYDLGVFLSPLTSRRLLTDAGFTCPRLIYQGDAKTVVLQYKDFEVWANQPAEWAEGKAEGVYVKVHDTEIIHHRYKMVREDFVRGAFWDNKELKKNATAT